MALATRCPYCATTFRVAHDQLKLRAGLVRCGACKQIFNGVENLLGPELPPANRPAPSIPKPAAPVAAQASAPASAVAAPPPAPAASPSNFSAGMPAAAGAATPSSLNLSPPTALPDSTTIRGPAQIDFADAGDTTAVDPLTRMTLMDFTAFEEADAAVTRHEAQLRSAAVSPVDGPDEIERALEDLHQRPWRGQASAKGPDNDSISYDEAEEPDFVRHARRRQKIGQRMKWMLGLGSLLLALMLAAQLAYTFRDQLAQRLPQAAPLLQQACEYLDCRISFPAPIHALAIESSELQALPAQANSFQLRVLLRNRYDTQVAWPYLELSLNDLQERTVARRSFSPAEYLSLPEQLDAGFAPHSEQAINLSFVLQGEQASGFRVYLFYP